MKEREPIEWAEILRRIGDQQAVAIDNATINVGSQFRNGTVAREFSLTNCIVRGTLTFHSVTFGETVSFTDTVFEDGVNLTGCRIQGQFVSSSVAFRRVAEFEGLSVGGRASFEKTVFAAPANFGMSSWGPLTNFDATTFDAGAVFSSVTSAGRMVFANGTRSAGPIDFSLATIGGMFRVAKAQFDREVILANAQIKGALHALDSVFGVDASLGMYHARVDGDVSIKQCQFLTAGEALNLRGARIDGGTTIGPVSCAGGVSLGDAKFGSYLAIGGLHRETDGQPGLPTRFDSTFSLAGARVEGFLNCFDVEFRKAGQMPPDERQEADFTGLKVGDDTYIMRCVFERGVLFHRSRFTGVFGTDARYAGFAGFQGSRFHRAVRFLRGTVFEADAEFYFCNFDEEANFGGARIRRSLNLLHCRFLHSLLFDLPTQSSRTQFEESATLRLDGSTYEALVPATAASVLELIGRIPLEPREDASFIVLERQLRRSGRPDEADAVRYERFTRQGGRLSLLSREVGQWAWSRFYRISTRYGTRGWRVLVVAVSSGATAVAVVYTGWPAKPESDAIATVFAAVGGFALALWVEPLKRRLWPE